MKKIKKKIISMMTSLLMTGSCSSSKAFDNDSYEEYQEDYQDSEEEENDADDIYDKDYTENENETDLLNELGDNAVSFIENPLAWPIIMGSLSIACKKYLTRKNIPLLDNTICKLIEQDNDDSFIKGKKYNIENIKCCPVSMRIKLFWDIIEKHSDFIPKNGVSLKRYVIMNDRNKRILNGNLYTSEPLKKQIVSHSFTYNYWDKISFFCFISELGKTLGLDSILKISKSDDLSLVLRFTDFQNKDKLVEIGLNDLKKDKRGIKVKEWDSLQIGERYISNYGNKMYCIKQNVNLKNTEPPVREKIKLGDNLPKAIQGLAKKIEKKLNALNVESNNLVTKLLGHAEEEDLKKWQQYVFDGNELIRNESKMPQLSGWFRNCFFDKENEPGKSGEWFRYIFYGDLQKNNSVEELLPSSNTEKLLCLTFGEYKFK